MPRFRVELFIHGNMVTALEVTAKDKMMATTTAAQQFDIKVTEINDRQRDS